MGRMSECRLICFVASSLCSLLLACGSGPRVVTDRIDPTLPHAVIGSPGWEYARVASGDLDGDGVEEHAVILARVTLRDGQPVWDDWNVWQVFVEEPTGERTYVYSGPVQLGMLEPSLTEPDGSGRRSFVLVEHTPYAVAMYEVAYEGPGRARLLALAERTIDRTRPFASP